MPLPFEGFEDMDAEGNPIAPPPAPAYVDYDEGGPGGSEDLLSSDPMDLRSVNESIRSNTDFAVNHPPPATEQELRQRRMDANLAALDNPTIANMRAAEQAGADAQASYGALAPRSSTGPRPFYREVKDYNERETELNMQRREDQSGVDTALLREQVVSAQIAEYTAQEHRATLMEARANEVEAARRENEQIDRIREAQQLAAEAARDFSKNEIDPRRAVKNMGFGMKIIAVLGAAFSGAHGDANPTAHIDFLIDRDIEAQRQNASIRQMSANNARDNVGTEQEIYQRILARSANQREADDIYKLGRLQQIQLQGNAMLQGAGITTLNAVQQQVVTRLDQEINALQLALNKQRAANTPMVMRSSAPTGAQARLLEYQGKKAIDAQYDATGRIADVGMEREKMRSSEGIAGAARADKRSERQAEQATTRERGPQGTVAQRERFAALSAPSAQVISAIDEFLAANDGKDISGITPMMGSPLSDLPVGAHRFGEDARKTHQELRAIQQLMGRAWSQGVVTDDELKEFSGMVYDGVGLGGDDELRSNLNIVRKAFIQKIEAYERGVDPAAIQGFTNNPDAASPKRIPSYGGDPSAPSLVEDQ